MGQARRLAWEPESVPRVHHANQPSSTLEGQVLHHLVQEEHLGPTVAELEDPRHRQLAPETKGRLASWLQRVQELFQTPVQELRPVSPASAPAELEDIQAEASAPRQGPKLEPQEHSGLGRRATAIMVPGLTEPEPCPDPMSPWDIPGVVTAPVPGPELEPHEPLGPGPVAPAGMALGLSEPEADPEPTSTCVAITRDVWRKEEWTILAFPHSLVAEQLTLICAGLYDRMEFVECNSYLQNQPQIGDIERLALTMYRVLWECDALVKLVTTTCLGTLSMMASDRAKVVRFWIWVAMVCHGMPPGSPPSPALRMGACGLPCTVPGPLLPGVCGPALTGPKGGTAIPGPFLGLCYSPPPRRAAQQVSGVLGSLGVCLLKDRSSWGDRVEKQATLSALSSVPGESEPQELCCPSCHCLGPAEPCYSSSGKHLGTCLLRLPDGIRRPENAGQLGAQEAAVQGAGVHIEGKAAGPHGTGGEEDKGHGSLPRNDPGRFRRQTPGI
ncbi:uncharacterized protein [Manis javanica]